GLLTPLGPVLDGVVQPLLELLGVRLGEADLRVHGVRCPNQQGAPQLVGRGATVPGDQPSAGRRPLAACCTAAGRRWPPAAMMRSMRAFSARKAFRSAPARTVPSWVLMPEGLIRWPLRQIS